MAETSPLREAAVEALLAEFHRLAGQRGPAVGRVVSARDRAELFADAVLAVVAAELLPCPVCRGSGVAR